jgi:tryptophan synthase beta subunit
LAATIYYDADADLSVIQGKKVAIVDCTGGEMGSRGTAAERKQEAIAAAAALGVAERRNLDLPDTAVAVDDDSVRLIGVEAAGRGLDGPDHAASLQGGRPGVLHGNRTYLLQDDDGQILEGHSISAGLDYPGIGPEHAWLKDIGRAEYRAATDVEALEAFQLCSKLEGIIPALEPSHALARIGEIATEVGKGGDVVLNMCGRGDKDIFAVAKHLGVEL